MVEEATASFVVVALVASRFVNVPRVAVRIDEKKFVEVAWVVVERLKIFPPDQVLKSARRVEEALEPPEVKHVPPIAKHPPVGRLIPLPKVVVPLPETFRNVVVALVVVERAKVFPPDQVLKSERSVEDAEFATLFITQM
jgi:hypothetical protein